MSITVGDLLDSNPAIGRMVKELAEGHLEAGVLGKVVAMTAMELRSQILDAKDIRSELVDVPEWGCEVLVYGMTSRERGLMMDRARSATGEVTMIGMEPFIVQLCARDPESKKAIFQPTDIEVLAGKSAKAIARVSDVALRLSGITEEAKKELEKNLQPASGGSTSDLPANSE